MINWLLPEQAPKDGTVIIARFELHPCVTIAAWDESLEQWALAEMGVEQIDDKNSVYFQTETFKHKYLTMWADIVNEQKQDAAVKRKKITDQTHYCDYCDKETKYTVKLIRDASIVPAEYASHEEHAFFANGDSIYRITCTECDNSYDEV